MLNMFAIDLIAVFLLFGIGLYTMIMAKNMLRILIGFEIMAKGATLALISAGNANGKIAFSQALVITVIVVEVVFVTTVLAIVMLNLKNKKSLDVRKLTNLKG